MPRLSPLFLMLVLPACDVEDGHLSAPAEAEAEAEPACGPGFEKTEDGCMFSEEAIAQVIATFDQGALVKVNREPFLQTMGPPLERNVWINRLPVEREDGEPMDTLQLYAQVDPFDQAQVLPAEFPVGTVIVHETIDLSEGHTVQVKLGEDAGEFADENGRDWYFGKFFADGEPDEDPCSPCAACHNDTYAPGTDGLKGVPSDVL